MSEIQNGPYTYDADARANRINYGSNQKLRMVNILTICASGFALISDGYQGGVMSLLNIVFAIEFPKVYKPDVATRVSNAALVGTIFGQIAVGIMCDYISRKFSIVLATSFLVIGAIGCAASHGSTPMALFWMLTVFRGITGFGIGAEYPSSSVSANEASNEHTRKKRGGIMVLVTNLPLSLGGPFAAIIFLIVYTICGKHNLNAVWRTMYALGCFWPLSVFYFRLKMASSELYKKGAIRKQTVPYGLALKYSWKRLLGACGCWFMFDFIDFPIGIFAADIIASVLPGKEAGDLKKLAEWNLFLALMSIPALLLGAYLCDIIGRKYLLMLGFSGYIVFGLVIGLVYEKIAKIHGLFIWMFAMMGSFGNMGPGNMLGVVSSESFPTPIRGTAYGLCAAIGKVGAVVGTQCFTPIRAHLGKKWTFIIAAIAGVIGVACAFFLVPHLKEDDLMKQDIDFMNYLRANGWDGDFGNGEVDNADSNIDSDLAGSITYEKKDGVVINVVEK